MPLRDLRQWMEVLYESGELVELGQEIDWNLEVGAITRRAYETLAPVPLFVNVKGYPGYRVLSSPIGLSARNRFSRLALALDLPADTSLRRLTEVYLERRMKPIPPQVVTDAPCQENVHLGDDVDLLEFPVPLLHPHDGGRYIATWHSNVTRDPNTGWVNYGMYRMMVHARNQLVERSGPLQHGQEHWSALKARGQRMEFAVAIGTDPITAIISATPLPDYVSEPDAIGGMLGEPLKVVKCKTVDLYVPAMAEIVIEGYVNPDERQYEGPFGEYTGYYAGSRAPRPLNVVTGITHRDNPILTVTCPGVPLGDNVIHLTRGMELQLELVEKYGFPIDSLYLPGEGVGHLCVVATKVPDSTYVNRLAMALWSTKAGRTFINNLIVVNDDVDVTDLRQVVWAWTTRMHPLRGVWQVPKSFCNTLTPWATPAERESHLGGRILFDATWPVDWPPDWIPKVSSFEASWPGEMKDHVLRRWREFGFPE